MDKVYSMLRGYDIFKVQHSYYFDGVYEKE